MRKPFILLILVLSLAATQGIAQSSDSTAAEPGQETAFLSHVIKPGETLYAISRQYGVSVDRLAEENPGAMDGLRYDERLKIPTSGKGTGLPQTPQQPEDSTDTPIYHTVQKGENLYRISLKYSTTVAQVQRWNKLPSESIYAGQRLLVGYGDRSASLPQTAPSTPTTATSAPSNNLSSTGTITNNNLAVSSTITFANYDSLAYDTALARQYLDQLLQSIAWDNELGRVVFDKKQVEKISKAVESLYEQEVNEEQRQAFDPDTSLLRWVYTTQYADSYQAAIKDSLLESQMKSARKDWGLQVQGGVTENLQPGLSDAEDLLFRRRAYTGVGLNIFKGGIYEARTKQKQLRKDREINRLLSLKETKEDNYVYTYNYIIYNFNKTKSQYLQDRINILDKYIDLAVKMYYIRLMPWDAVIEMKSKRAEAERMLQNYTIYNGNLEQQYLAITYDSLALNIRQLPVVDILVDTLFTAEDSMSLDKRLIDLQIDRIQTQDKPLNNISLRPYARYNVFTNTFNESRTFASVGLTFNAPLPLNINHKKTRQLESDLVRTRATLQNTARANEVLNLYYEYQYKLKQYVEFQYKKIYSYERLRKEYVKKQLSDPDFSPLHALRLIDNIYAIEVELLDIKQNLYLKLLKLYTYSPFDNPNSFTSVIASDLYYSKYVGQRSIYLWSKGFNKHSNSFLVEYLKTNEIKEVMLSPGPKPDLSKLKAFIKLAAKSNIRTHLMIGNNSLVNNPTKLQDKMNAYASVPFAGIHLDVEPHVLNDWGSRKEEYLSKYATLVQQAERLSRSRSLELSVSIPVFYPTTTLNTIYPLCNKVYIMAYEHKDVDYIIRKTQEEMAVSKNKTVLALRTDDFTNRVDFEEFITQLLKQSPSPWLAIHDLSSLLEMEQETIINQQK